MPPRRSPARRTRARRARRRPLTSSRSPLLAGRLACLDAPEGDRHALAFQGYVVAGDLRILQLDVLDIRDAVELAGEIDKMQDLVEPASERDLERNPDVVVGD